MKAALDAVRSRCDVAARREADPVAFAHAYADANDRELVALVAACSAFGNVKTIRAKVGDLLARLGPHPGAAADDPRALRAALRGWKHRVFLGDDLARLLAGARAVQRAHGSLGALFRAELARADSAARAVPARRGAGGVASGPLRDALGAWCDAIRAAGDLRTDGPRRGPAHLLPDPRGPSACKRLLLFLRWMIRPSDGVDLGLWHVDAARLFVPVDVHIRKISYNLGFTREAAATWRAAEEITAALARFDAADPTKYDFSLCHMGMLQRCPSRKDALRCEGCGVQPVCIHWARSGAGTPQETVRRARPNEGANEAGPVTTGAKMAQDVARASSRRRNGSVSLGSGKV